MTEPDRLQVRACTEADLAAMLALARTVEERVGGRPSQLVAGDVRGWIQSVDLATGSWLVTEPDGGQPVGVGWLDQQGPELGYCFPFVAGDRAAVLASIVDRVEGRAAELRLSRLHLGGLLPDPVLQDLAEARGYRPVRRFYDMAIALDVAPPAVTVPPGLTLRPMTTARGRAFHQALTEAFQDHWEHHPEPFDEWWRDRTADPDVDLSWWFTLDDGDEIAAAIRTVPARNGGVYVAALGVRRGWRGRGLAKALLRQTFARAWDAGFRRVTLGVDASSPTGATQLYGSVGMTVEFESGFWERA